MQRTTISLPDELAAALERESRRRAMPASAMARAALTATLAFGGPNQQRELPFAALGRSDTVREMEELRPELVER